MTPGLQVPVPGMLRLFVPISHPVELNTTALIDATRPRRRTALRFTSHPLQPVPVPLHVHERVARKLTELCGIHFDGT